MELFRLFGTILVDNEKANKSISKTESQAKGSSDGMASAFKKVGTALTAAFSVQKPEKQQFVPLNCPKSLQECRFLW